MSPPKASKKLEEPGVPDEAANPSAPSVKKGKKSAGDKAKKKAAKDDGMVVPPINVLIVEGQSRVL